ncbi:RIP metalloprotease RseP [Peptoniphilus equinus]|uniref:Zinc metalloprotease n=1 Tax=Peptoniphilus equinus TaxID=3016343 RepID=A0ABY7QV63_9FIRM|nr:RIP metalloprotease RseP [Peptoniphilus equinus]WBW50672.1 RIP metalloprotease RseP [Peptoniphilus equinus]
MSTLIGSIIVFMLVITLHEMGHFFAAKKSGIKVNEFSIGMGPKLVQTRRGETDYSIRALPIGGYVAMEGEEENSYDPRAFNNVSVYKRMAVVVAGVVMNFLLAVLAFTLVAALLGVQTNTIGEVIANSPADEAHLQPGDTIVAINSTAITDWEGVLKGISQSGGSVDVTVQRDGANTTVRLTPLEESGRRVIGIYAKEERNGIRAIESGFSQTFFVIKEVFTTLGTLITGKTDVKMLAGPVGVISIIGQETAKGFVYLLNILGLISANLAVINILPIPALDGGKLVFLIWEALTGKTLSEVWEQRITLVGMSLLFGLMLYVTVFGDLTRLLNG